MTRHFNIGYLIPQFPGQTHIFFWRELEALAQLGVTAQIFSTRPPPAGLISHDWSEEAIGRTKYLGRIRPLRALHTLLRISPRIWLRDVMREPALIKDLLICLAAADQLVRNCQEQDIDHVHVHSCGRAALIAALAHHLSGLTYSLTLHGPMSDYGIGQRLKWRNAAFGIVITRKLMSELPDQLASDRPERILVQGMGVDTNVLKRNTPYDPPLPGDPIRLFSCGRLNIVKGHQDLMQAVKILRDQGRNVRLEIAGEDDEGGTGFHHDLLQVRADLGLEEHVTLLGAISAEAVRDKLWSAHIFALASWHEPLGVAYMEAMACGIPVIATNSGGVPELITDGENGLMVPPQNPTALAEAIQRICEDPDLARRLGQNGRKYAEENCRSSQAAEVLRDEIALL